MITASRDILFNVLAGEWRERNIRVIQVSSDGDVYSKVFKLEDFIFDEIDACENCRAPSSYCVDCDGVVEILALVGSTRVNRRKVEDGLVVPLLGDVLFDLREGHVSILTDTDVIVISRVGKELLQGDNAGIGDLVPGSFTGRVGGKDEKVNLRMYLVSGNKIKRLAVNALQDGRLFHELAGKKAVALELTFIRQDKTPLYIRSLRLFYVYFDLDGRVNEELTFPRRRLGDQPKHHSGEKVVEIGRRDKEPELTSTQKEIIKQRLLKDFGPEVWNNTPVAVKAILE
ncbi:hypothetical protein JOC37_000650 [Desulfohalotomaculum tongense]|uniref:hypothetical protein n=1 Tax=Desulforadius tongensis TaxID=1216062 RepID=UPI0019583D29|nr:hypothetical protein [Desulforadius tongensis]MBM7854277.1 hypothetical protein [Desulforadius tongensis]